MIKCSIIPCNLYVLLDVPCTETSQCVAAIDGLSFGAATYASQEKSYNNYSYSKMFYSKILNN